MLEKNLEKAGLSPKEVRIYLAGIKAGPVLASSLAKKTGINRPNVYDNLKSLMKKGLVYTVGDKYNQRFIMEDPENLERYLNRKKKEVERMKDYLKMAIPEISAITDQRTKAPRIKFIEGEESLRNAIIDSLKCKNKEVLAVIASQELYDTLGVEFTKSYVEQRIRENIKTRTVRLKSREDYSEEYFHKHEEQLRDIRYAPENIDFSESFFVYDNTTVYISSKRESFGLVIESEEHGTMMKMMFETLWTASKKIVSK